MKLIREINLNVVVTSYCPGDPGRISGPPEDCYPPEPAEIEFDLFTCTGGPIPQSLFTEDEWEK